MVKVLYICPGKFGLGGVQVTIMNLAKYLTPDYAQIDVVVFSDDEGFYENEFKKYGRIFRIHPYRARNKFQKSIKPYLDMSILYRGIKQIIYKYGPYDAIHAAYLFLSAPCVQAAHELNIPVRIAHSHVARPSESPPLYIKVYSHIFESICRKKIKKHATVGLGVTQGAIDYLFEDFANAHVIRNPVLDMKKFDIKLYQQVPDECIRLLQVGNFSERKNPLFSIRILYWLIKMGFQVHLTLLGNDNHIGHPYLNKMMQEIEKYRLESHITFLPQDYNVAKAMADSDYLIVPSLQEGLPNVVLEGQQMGLRCFLSDDISSEADCGLCVFYSRSIGPEEWAKNIIDYYLSMGKEKTIIDMSKYSMENVCFEHLMIWEGKKYNQE